MIREANAMQISVMSFNIQHCLNYRTRQIDFDLFAQVIRQSGADIVGLNEVNGVQAQTICRRLRFWPKGWDFTPISHKRSRLMVSIPTGMRCCPVTRSRRRRPFSYRIRRHADMPGIMRRAVC